MRAGLPARASRSTARKEDRLFDDETDAEAKPASNFYASEQISECAVTESTRTLIVAPGVIPGTAGENAVFNSRVLPAGIPQPPPPGPPPRTPHFLSIIARFPAVPGCSLLALPPSR